MNTQQTLTLAVSILSILLAATSLGWNIYRDVILRPRVKVTASVVRLVTLGVREPPSPPSLNITGTNFGPGRVVLVMIHAWKMPLWRRLLRCPRRGIVAFDYRNPLSGRLPTKVDVGDKVDLLLPWTESMFAKDKGITHVGLADSFGRIHWVPRKMVREVQREWQHDFGPRRPRLS